MTRPPIWTEQHRDTLRDLIKQGLRSADVAEQMPFSRGSIIDAAARYGLGPWLSKPGVKAKASAAIPRDFAKKRERMTKAQLCRHYRRGMTTISAWESALKLPPKVREPRKTKVKWAPPVNDKPRAIPANTSTKPTTPIDRYQRDMSAEGQAQEVLQRDGWVVYRCTSTGMPSHGGSHWQCGRLVVTGAELVERAERVLRRRAA